MNRTLWLGILILMSIERVISQGYRHGYKPKDNKFVSMDCADCEKVNEDCKIEQTGFYCESPDDASAIEYKDNSVIPDHLKKCMPKNHYFSEITSIQKTCCFWSPELGCQVVKGRDKQAECSKCLVEGTVRQILPEGCPCISKKSEEKSTNGQGNTWKSHSYLLLIMTRFYFI
ncbi:uncharacterized protein LOC127011529 [Drosophila biarmipes]|uniref:uncharacterized protein LOC127011529 n=1 Tax=Drosophila biarmipes TaxID=125945 RepID=UPI0021CD074D|nr:uncharacterized protein LOC127011529 [Drosophila biarmipes]